MEEIKPSIRWNLNNLLYGLDIEKLKLFGKYEGKVNRI